MLGEVVLLLAASAVAVVPPPVADPLAAQEVPLSEAGYGAQDFERKNGDRGNIPQQNIWNSPAERAHLRAKVPCEGECISKKKAQKKCNGIVDKSFKCSGKKKVCCLPDNTTPSVPLTCPEVTCPPCRTETYYTEESFPWYWTDPTSETPWWTYNSDSTEKSSSVFPTKNTHWWTYNSDSTEKPSSVFPTKRCPEGFFQIFHTRHPSPCYIFYDDTLRSYSDAKEMCQIEGLALPEPVNPIALRKYLVENYVVGSRMHAHVWLGARSTGLYFKWERSGRQISNSDSLWAPPYPGSLISSSYCLELLAQKTYWLTNYPNKPYAPSPCYNMRYTLCEYVMN